MKRIPTFRPLATVEGIAFNVHKIPLESRSPIYTFSLMSNDIHIGTVSCDVRLTGVTEAMNSIKNGSKVRATGNLSGVRHEFGRLLTVLKVEVL